MNAMLYFAWLHEKNFSISTQGFFERITYSFSLIFFTKKFREKIFRKLEQRKVQFDKSKNNNLKDGFYIQKAKYWFGYFSAGYPALISFITLGFILRIFHDISKLEMILLFAIPIGLSSIPDHKYLYSKDKYIEYFKQFKKEDERWHKKWKRIATVYFIGAILSYPLGAFIGLAIAIL